MYRKPEERRKEIARCLTTKRPVSATTLAEQFGVSRQIIVGDIALLRAGGLDVVATPRGYRLGEEDGLTHTVACIHTAEQTEAELLAIVDNGCDVIDVVVEHPIYGQITGQLSISSRYDVAQFIEKCAVSVPLSALTDGVHIHNIRCPDEDAYRRVHEALEKLGVLYNPENG